MKTDRELLELAAKAAGYVIQGEAEKMVAQCDHFFGGFVILNENGGSSLWNPLTDNGNALQLEVDLDIEHSFHDDGVNDGVNAGVWSCEPGKKWDDPIPYGRDKAAAARRAIVRAAAAIGEGMK